MALREEVVTKADQSKRLPLVYIAGPYTNPDPVENTHRAIRAGLKLYDTEKAVPFIPHLTLLAHMVDPRPVDYWYRLDLDQLRHCDALWRLPGASTGADAEVGHAVVWDIPVFHHIAQVIEWTSVR